MLLEMAADGLGDRIALGPQGVGHHLRRAAGALPSGRGVAVGATGVERVGMVDLNSEAVPIALFGSAFAGLPFVPLNYRLADEQLRAILARTAPGRLVVDPPVVGAHRHHRRPRPRITRPDFLAAVSDDVGAAAARPGTATPTSIAVLLFTSGTTGEPKAAVLRHRHLVSYIISTVEFMGADEDEAALVSVPPYHIAGISAVLSRRLRRAPHRAAAGLRPRRVGRGRPATRPSPTPWSCRPCWAASST